ncbi:hypothetical protein, partial [Chitinimonas sp.]|uniref:hypothetical protein n=1 Tax=Chitinimonas sp. TaxID=1934313 RepID=UPI0035B366F9
YLSRALPIMQATLGSQHFETRHAAGYLGALRLRTGQFGSGQALMDQALAGQPPAHQLINVARSLYADVLLDQGQLKRASECLDAARADIARNPGSKYPRILLQEARLDASQGRYDAAIKKLGELERSYTADGKGQSALMAPVLQARFDAEFSLDRLVQAEETLSRLRGLPEVEGSAFALNQASSQIRAAKLLLAQGRTDAAGKAYAELLGGLAAAHIETQFPKLWSDALLGQADVLLRQGEGDGAMSRIQSVVRFWEGRDQAGIWLAQARLALANCLLRQHKIEQARVSLEQAKREIDEQGAGNAFAAQLDALMRLTKHG